MKNTRITFLANKKQQLEAKKEELKLGLIYVNKPSLETLSLVATIDLYIDLVSSKDIMVIQGLAQLDGVTDSSVIYKNFADQIQTQLVAQQALYDYYLSAKMDKVKKSDFLHEISEQKKFI